MAEFQNWNLGREFSEGYERGQQTRRQDQFRALAGQAINAPAAERDALIQQAIANDPESGFALQKQLEADTDRRQKALFNMARGFKQIHSKNPAQAMAYFQRQIAPGLGKIGFDVDPNTPETEVVNVVDQVLATYGGDESAEPAGFRQIDLAARAAGFEPGTPEYQNYFQVHGGIKGRAPTGGFNFELVPGVGYVRENPRSGTLEVYDPQTRSIVPIVGGADINAGAPSAAPSPIGGVPAPTVNIEGLTPEQNQQLGAFIAGLSPAQADAAVSAVAGRPRVAAPSPAVQRFGEITSRTPEQQAYLTELQKQQAQIDTYRQRAGLEAEGAAAKTFAEETAKAQAAIQNLQSKKSVQAADVLSLLDSAEPLVKRSTGSGAGAKRDQALGFFGASTEGADAIAALQPISAALVGNVPRMEGPQSDADRRLYEQAAGDLANATKPVSQRIAAIQTMRRLQEKYKRFNQGEQAQADPADSTVRTIRYDARGNRIP